MKIKLLMATFLVVVTIATSGCIGEKEKTVKMPGGEVVISEGSSSPENWCNAGTSIKSTMPMGESTFTIKGITTFKGKDVCEAEANISGENAGTMVYYFTKDNNFTYFIMKDPSGKVINEMELTK